MTAIEAGIIADETIDWWRKRVRDYRCYEAWDALTEGREPYPGGGWERVRAKMVDWLLAQDAAERFELRRAA